MKLNVQYPRTFEPHIKEDIWIFIGIEGSTIWKVLNTQTLAVIRTTDAKFDKYIFPGIISPRI